MDKSETLIDFNRICRLCMTEESSMSSIFTEETGMVPLPLRIMACVSIEITATDGLPSQICNTCLCQVDGWYKFKDLCENTDSTLRKLISSEPVHYDNIAQIQSAAQDVKMHFTPLCNKNDKVEVSQPVNAPDERKKLNTPADSNKDGDSFCQFFLKNQIENAESIESASGMKKLGEEDTQECENDVSETVASTSRETKQQSRLNCSTCGRNFATRSSLKNHRSRLHEGKVRYTCEHCSKGFISRAHYVLHIRVHTAEKPFACKFCNKTFASNSNLMLHLRMHTGDKRHCCDLCGYATITKSNLNSHMRRHAGDKNVICHVCGKGFLSRGCLNAHLVSHSDNRTFTCKTCNAKFKTARYLRGHINSVHLKVKPFVCDICKKTFSRKANLNEHLVTHNRNKVKLRRLL